jgi:Kef-type K+ transport system membrane component KefB
MLAFGCQSVGFTGGGALASLVTTCVAARQWKKIGDEKEKKEAEEAEEIEKGPHDDHEAPQGLKKDDPRQWATAVEHDLAFIWGKFAQPLLFCVIGASLSFRELDPSTIPWSICIVLIGVSVRCPVAGLSLCWTPITRLERTFVGLAWIPKATVQAALGGIPLDVVRTTMHRDHDPELYDKYEQWGLQILTTAVFSILITAPIGLLVIQNLGKKMAELRR